MMKQWSLFFFNLILAPQVSWAAACCGGSLATPSLIAGDEKALFSATYSFTEVVVDSVDSRGIWHKWDQHQKVQTLKIDGAHLISDRWQIGATVPVMQRSRIDGSDSGLGDISVSLAYEYLPDWNYNPIRPKGIGFLQLILPGSKARAESDQGGLDSRGNGFWALGIGTHLSKTLGRSDVFGSLAIHRSFPKVFSNSSFQGTLEPGFGGNFVLGGGCSFGPVRIGGSLTWTYEDPVRIRGNFWSEGTPERYATAVLSASYFSGDAWTGAFSFSDQTLIGHPVNTSLGKTVSFMLQKRWNR